MNIERFEEIFPIGTEVRFYPISGEPEYEKTVIRSEPWALGHGEVVVKVKGRAGGVCISNIGFLNE